MFASETSSIPRLEGLVFVSEISEPVWTLIKVCSTGALLVAIILAIVSLLNRRFGAAVSALFMGAAFYLLPVLLTNPNDSEDETPRPAPGRTASPSPTPEGTEPPRDPGSIQIPEVHVPPSTIILVVISLVVVLLVVSGGRYASKRFAELHAAAEDRRARQEEFNTKWGEALETHDRLDAEWHSYEESLETILKTPLMRDLSDSAVAEAVRAMSLARTLRSETAPKLGAGKESDHNEYLLAVSAYKVALRAAQQKAQLRGLDDFSRDEQEKLKTAQRLLAMAMDPGATEAERQGAYDRVVSILRKMKTLDVPEKAFDKIELTSGLTPRAAITGGPARSAGSTV